MHKVYLSLGSNLGDREATMRSAIEMLNERAGTVDRQSSFIETEPWGFESANRFMNMCVRLLTALQPAELLEATKQIERELGRTQKSVDGQYHDRPIDIDILMYDDLEDTLPAMPAAADKNEEKIFLTTFSGYDSQLMAADVLREWHPDFRWTCKGWSDIDKYACQMHNLVFPQFADCALGDITKIDWHKVKRSLEDVGQHVNDDTVSSLLVLL